MPIPVIDFSKLNGEEREKTMAEIANGCEEWGFFQLVNHGIPVELLERVKKVTTECYKVEREENFFKDSTPVKLLKELIEKNGEEKLENLDWEDVFLLTDDNEWPRKTPGFK
ncbi:putative aminocyclopropanecarboxylate oxidase [Helianthus debilis subsp. tardiflorus]